MIYYVRGSSIVAVECEGFKNDSVISMLAMRSDFVFETNNDGTVSFIKTRELSPPKVSFFKISDALRMMERHYYERGFIVEYEIFTKRQISFDNRELLMNIIEDIKKELDNGISIN